MKPISILTYCLVLVGFMALGLCGCKTQANLWSDLERAAHPAGQGMQETRFALIGKIQTVEGTFFVVDQCLVVKGMLAPHGQEKLLLFDNRRRLVKAYSVRTAIPLWCEGPRIYLGGPGDFWNIQLDPRINAMFGKDEAPNGGNVLDFSGGIEHPYITREKKYGSSGGIEDDPWISAQTSR